MDYKISFITPTHKPNKYLVELFESIKAQTYLNWEWVIWANGSVTAKDLPKEILDYCNSDPQQKVKIFEDPSGHGLFVGHHKKEAFSRGTGEILVEVDHDDLLLPECAEELNKAFADLEVGFVYSDDLKLHVEDKFAPYNPSHGWTFDLIPWRDKKLYRMHSFEPSAQSVAFIWYAPDHVRAWRKTVYDEIGGHNPELEICDDQELMIRTYLRTRMKHIPKPLYVYRITGDNTWLEKNEKIQTETVRIYKEYGFKLAERDCDLKGLLKIDLGGGLNPKEGYISIDQRNGQIKCDLNDGIPLKDNSVGVLNASHIIEHLRDPLKTMSEIYRVLADGGWAMIEVPSTDGRGAFQDPTHVSFWNENSFWYYTKSSKAKYIDNSSIRFQVFRNDTVWWDNKIAVTHCWLTAIKSNKRRPALIDI